MQVGMAQRTGRPREGDHVMKQALTIRFPPAVMEALKGIATERDDDPSIGQVVREIVARSLRDQGRL